MAQLHHARFAAIGQLKARILGWNVTLGNEPFAQVLARLTGFMVDLLQGRYPAQELAAIAFLALLPVEEIVDEVIHGVRLRGTFMSDDSAWILRNLYARAACLNYATTMSVVPSHCRGPVSV